MGNHSSTSPLNQHQSWEFLHQGSAESFVEALCADALAHEAVNHPYLQRLASGDLPNVSLAIRDYCHQYYFYSEPFTAYLEAVIDGLSAESHKEVLRENLEEELGNDPANPENIPHTELFQRFQLAAGVTPEYKAATPPCTTVSVWRDLFLQKCHSQQEGVGLGAIGIGTEMIVSTIYRYLFEAVTQHTDLTPDEYLFLPLHMECDDEHAENMKKISIELADDYDMREALRFGVMSSLNLRNAFWDVMLARAVAA